MTLSFDSAGVVDPAGSPDPSRLVFGSVCSGIEAASMAWGPLGWRAAFVSEIEAFPRAVLKHRHPEVPLHGDFTTIEAGQYAAIDLLVGGTPCQSFSVAGLRGGLSDSRGNLALEFLRLADRLRPRWLVWENVPGVFSATSHDAPDPCPPQDDLDGDDGPEDGAEVVVEDEYDADEDHALACFLAGLSELGYFWAYRVLDAQYAGVPQRRRRIFVVGYLGDWRPPAAVLFERASLSGDPPPRRGAGEGAAGTLAGGARGRDGYSHDDVPLTAAPAAGGMDGLGVPELRRGEPGPGVALDLRMVRGDVGAPVQPGLDRPLAFGGNNTAGAIDVATAVTAVTAHGGPHGRCDFESETFVAQTLRARDHARGVDSDCTDTLIPHCFDARQSDVLQYGNLTCPLDTDGHTMAVAFGSKDHGADAEVELAPTLRAGGHAGSHANAGVPPAVAFALRGREGGAIPEVEGDGQNAGALRAANGGSSRDYVAGPLPFDTAQIASSAIAGLSVRRLTPRECERLQGFPDDYTLIPWRGGMAPDGPRYKALGNSMAVPVMRWIGERIALVDAMVQAADRDGTAA